MDGENRSGLNKGVDKLPDKKIFFVIGVFFGVLVLLSIAFLVLTNLSKTKSPSGAGLFTNRETDDKQTQQSTSPATTASIYPPPPKFQTQQWTMSLRAQPDNVLPSQQYVFKQNFTSSEIRTFVQKLFVPQVFKTTNNQILAYTLNPTTKDTEAVRFNPQSGAFSFVSTKGISITQSGESVSNESIYKFLRSIDLYDPSMQVTAQYKNSTNPGLTYYELHRDWHRMGLPVLSFVGLLNLPGDQNLSALSLDSSAGAVSDSTITTATDGKTGLQRLNDFNTITVIVDNSKKVIGVESNMRKMDTTKTQTKNLISYADAETKLKNNEYEIIFNSPAGGGVVPWNKMYPANTADASNAIVTDAIYTYLEQPVSISQSVLKPYILFKGYATLTNGYRSDFVTAIPAEQTTVLGASTSTGSTLLAQQQQGNTIQPTVEPTIQVPIPTTAPECAEEHSRIAPFDIAISFMGITLVHAPYFEYQKNVNETWGNFYREDNGGHGDWYYVPPENFNQAQLTTDLKKIKDNLLGFMNAIGYKGGEGFRVDEKTGEWTAVWNDVNHTWGDDRVNYDWGHRCPIRFTGHSPTLFLYGNPGQSVQVYPSNSLYVDPALNSDHWTVNINGSYDLLVNNVQRPYLYYEYSSVTFNKPKMGWIIDKNQLTVFAGKVGSQLGLNSTEKDRLIIELTQGANMISDGKMFIGLIDAQELNKKLPLKMTPLPDKVYRYHFYISSAESQTTAPKLTPLQRTTFMAVELGVYTAQ